MMNYDHFFGCLRILNADPTILDGVDQTTAAMLIERLEDIKTSLDDPLEELDLLIERFMTVWSQQDALPAPDAPPDFRGMFPKSETVPPRMVLSDAVLMTLQRLEM